MWTYKHSTKGFKLPPEISGWSLTKACPYCKKSLKELYDSGPSDVLSGNVATENDYDRRSAHVHICRLCGWWVYSHQATWQHYDTEFGLSVSGIWGLLHRLDTPDVSKAIDKLRAELVRDYETRKTIHPRRFEQLVGSVFRDFGYYVRVTNYSRDGGIDLVALDGDSSERIGIQVKRYNNKIQVNQIREFAGALLLEKHTKGVFVTTAEFTRGSKETAQACASIGIPIELVDSHAFFDKLEIAQKEKSYRSKSENDTPWSKFILKPPSNMPQLYRTGGTFEW